MSIAAIDLSIVIPVYREEESLGIICDEFKKCISSTISYEIIFVNDGNFKNSIFETLSNLKKEKNIVVINLAQNYGQHVAIAAGLKNSRGAHSLVMDSDLQYRPADCFLLYQKAKEDKLDLVVSLIDKRAHSIYKKWGAQIFYYLMTKLGTELRPDLGSVFVISRKIAYGLAHMADRQRVTITMAMWLSQNRGYLQIPHSPRRFGKSGYSLPKLLWHGINGVISFSTKPLYVSLVFTVIFSLGAFGGVFYILFKVLIMKQKYLSGWASLLVVTLACAGIILGCITILGHYLGRVFELVKQRPLYFLQDENDSLKLFEDGEDLIKETI